MNEQNDIYGMLVSITALSIFTFVLTAFIFAKVFGSDADDDIRKIKKLLKKDKTPQP